MSTCWKCGGYQGQLAVCRGCYEKAKADSARVERDPNYSKNPHGGVTVYSKALEDTARRNSEGSAPGERSQGLAFAALAEVNIARCRRWHDPEGWSPQMWGLAMCGEAGEVANALKKLYRHDEGIQQNAESPDRAALLKAVATEIGDTAVYLDLLAQRLGLRLEDCVRDTFNRISVRENFPERL